MKPFWIASGILLTLFLSLQANTAYLAGFVNSLQEEVSASLQAVDEENWNLAQEHLQTAYNTWHDKSLYLHVTLKHADIDKIYVLLEEATAHLELQNNKEFSVASRTLMQQMNLLYEMERLSPQNIL